MTTYVLTGEVKVSSCSQVLQSSPLGSCIAVIAYDTVNKHCGLAHIMLPNKSPLGYTRGNNKYAVDAINFLFKSMIDIGSISINLEFAIVGGANVLKRKNDTIAQNNIDSVLQILNDNKFKLVAKSVGGTQRRTASVSATTGKLNYTIDDSAELLLYDFLNRN